MQASKQVKFASNFLRYDRYKMDMWQGKTGEAANWL